jgi:ureidoglycolate hydrolase
MFVKVRPLSAVDFSPYGDILSVGNPVLPEFDDSKPMATMVNLKRGPENHRLEQLSLHFSYSQIYMAVHGSLIMIVAPAPDSSEPDANGDYPLDYNNLAAIVFEPGEACLLKRGTWHSMAVVGDACTFMTLTRHRTSSSRSLGDITSGPFSSEVLANYKKLVPHMNLINFKERDGRAVHLVF